MARTTNAGRAAAAKPPLPPPTTPHAPAYRSEVPRGAAMEPSPPTPPRRRRPARHLEVEFASPLATPQNLPTWERDLVRDRLVRLLVPSVPLDSKFAPEARNDAQA